MSRERFMYDAEFHAFVETFRQIADIDIELALELVDDALEEADYHRPVYGCHRTDLPPLKLADADRMLREMYTPALSAAMNQTSILAQLITPHKLTRRQKVRRWIRRHTPRVRVTWGY